MPCTNEALANRWANSFAKQGHHTQYYHTKLKPIHTQQNPTTQKYPQKYGIMN